MALCLVCGVIGCKADCLELQLMFLDVDRCHVAEVVSTDRELCQCCGNYIGSGSDPRVCDTCLYAEVS